VAWRRWWGGLGLALAGAVPAAAATLTALRTEVGPGEARLTLALSAPVRAAVATVEEEGEVVRVYVDLPPGTRVGPGVARPVAPPEGVLTGVRVGLGEGGALRIVLDTHGARAARETRRRGGREIVVTVSAQPGAGEAVAHRPKIVLDPGHGGHDPGARGYGVEKDVTLAIAQRLAALLRERLGAEVVLTRRDDATLALADRTARANAEKADLFLSIHANADPHRRQHGVETYVLDNTTDHATARLAAMENGLGTDLLPARAGARDLRYILSDLVQVGKMDESVALARAVQRALVRRLRTRYPGVADLGVKRGPFYVLVGAYMPCVLVETAFLTHPVEGRRLTQPAYQEAVAEGLYAGVRDFLADGARRRTL
jgi:N-acetylmuramoyl-L-alanine amidase